MTLTLRPYQTEAVQAIYDHFDKSDDNCLIVVPTAGGKTAILTEVAGFVCTAFRCR